jgi:putative sterol carrier protein
LSLRNWLEPTPKPEVKLKADMKKAPTKISPDLTIPGFDVKVKNPHSCQVKSHDGRYQFSAEIEGYYVTFYGRMFAEPIVRELGTTDYEGTKLTTDADDAITQVAISLKLMKKLSSEGFSAKIKDDWLVLAHPSKPGYSLNITLADASKSVHLKNTSLYTAVYYCGPAYEDKETETKWKIRNINNFKLVVTNKDFEELAQEIKTRILSLGEEKDPRIAQWVTQEIENTLAPQGFTFSPKPEKAIVEFSHPSGLSGSLSFAPFTVGDNYDINPKFPNLKFPTDIEREKVVLFTCNRPNYREPYTKAFLAKNPQEVIDEFRRFLALPLVYKEVCKAWKSDILVPKLRHSEMLLINTELDGKEAIVLELNLEKDKLVLKGMGKRSSYQMSGTSTVVNTKAITQTIVEMAEKYVQKYVEVKRIPELVYKEVCNEWKSSLLVPKLSGNTLKLINTELIGKESIILELTVEKGKLRLKNKGKPYAISENPREIAQTIVGLAKNHDQEFIQNTGYSQPTTIVSEIDI